VSKALFIQFVEIRPDVFATHRAIHTAISAAIARAGDEAVGPNFNTP
jgi:hypothetical protein